MKYYISKPNAHKLDEDILNGIQRTDGEVVIVDSLEKADVCVFQNDWTKSRFCSKNEGQRFGNGFDVSE